MGKKGKKRKEKVTGTPDVVKFKGTHDFHTLKEAVVVQESLPFVASDLLNEMDMKKVSRFLHILGLLAGWATAASPKEYRFRLHHRFYHPAPQYFPTGYSKNIITGARWVVEKAELSFNGVAYPFSDELKHQADEFLKQVDTRMTNVSGFIELQLKDDFAGGLKVFKQSMKEKLTAHDDDWCAFEEAYMGALNETHTQVFQPVEKLVSLEDKLTKAEEQGNIELKQKLENELVCSLEEFVNLLFPDTTESKFPDDVIPLAEACVFYESKCKEPDWLNLCKHLIKAYLELRIFITNIPSERLHPQLHDNLKLIRLLKAFHKTVLDAHDALEAVAKFPRLAYCKTEGWRTKALLEPEVLEQMDGGRPR